MGTDQMFTKEKKFEIIVPLEQSLIHESLAFGWEETRIHSPFVLKNKTIKSTCYCNIKAEDTNELAASWDLFRSH